MVSVYLDYAIQNMPDEAILYLLKGKVLSERLDYPDWADVCFKQVDKCALKFVEKCINDADACKSLLHTLGKYGRVDAINGCRKILNETK